MCKLNFIDRTFRYSFRLSKEDFVIIPEINFDFCFIKEDYESLAKAKALFLSNKEIEQLNKYEFRKKRHNYLLGRAAVKSVISKNKSYKNLIKDCSVLNKITGKPIINIDNIDLSISHSSCSAAIVSFPRLIEISIDMEYIVNVEGITNFNFCSEEESELFKNLSYNFYNQVINSIIWSSKESLSKFIGTGFNILYKILEIESVVKFDDNILFIKYKNIKVAKTIVFIFFDLVISITIPYFTNIETVNDFYKCFNEYYTNLIS